MPVFDGTPGDDYLPGSSGADTLRGFAGNDIYLVDHSGDAVVEAADEGTDKVYALTSYVLTAGSRIETLTVTDHAAAVAINLFGNEFSNNIYGNNGVNVLNGGGGNDAMVGYGGNDIFVIDNAADIAIEYAGQGVDTVYTTTSYALNGGSEIETLTVTDHGLTTAINLTGNEYSNNLYGNNGVNALNGGGGNDAMVGYGGNDIFIVDNAADVAIEYAGQGVDKVYASTSYTLNGGSEIETLSVTDHGLTTAINFTGNEFGNTLLGNNGANTLNGAGGADAMFGFGGNDVFIIDNAADFVWEEANGGNDLAYALTSYTLTAGSRVETLSVANHAATTAIDLTGNELANSVLGNNGVNVLNGGGGADNLRGFGGADSFAFTTTLGAGNVDTIIDFTPGVDKIVLAGGQGDPFASLATGALGAGSFLSATPDPYAGAALPQPGSPAIWAMDGNDYILYNRSSGALLYDADGNGAGAAVQFATLQPGLSLTAADFFVSGPTNTPPTISSGSAASVAENSPAATIVYLAAATDADGDRFTWSLSGADAALLTIDAGGAVRLIAPADFEAKSTYEFNVVASDSSSATPKAVTLTIGNVADSTTPIINEVATSNDSTGTAQFIDRTTFIVAPNANLQDASLPSATIVGNLPNETDEDFFSITLQAGEKLILDVDNSGGNLDSHIHVFNAAGTMIGGNDDPGFLDPGSPPHPDYGHNTDSLFSFRAPTAGTYYFSIESFQDIDNPTFGSYQLNVSIGPPASEEEILAEMIAADIQALISGFKWPTTSITYSFPNDKTDYPPNAGESQFGDNEPASFLQFTPTQQAAVQQMLQQISNVSLLTFQQLTGANDGDAKLRFAMTDATEAAHAYYPGNSNEAGSAWFNKDDFVDPRRGSYDWMGILHETGHTLGLKHGHEDPAISSGRDSVEYTVMTYRSYPGQDLSAPGGYTNEMWGYPQSLMLYDIAALQKIYGGANYNYNFSDTHYSWNPNSGELSINFSGQGAPGANRIFMTIWDGNGIDTYDFQTYTTAVTIDLRPGEWSQTGSVQLADLGPGHFARGNIANALLFNDDPRSLIENARGGSGADTLIANRAANNLMGWQGPDTYKWMASADAGTGALADTIDGLSHGSDKIDLSNIDANPGTAANDAFAFIGTNAFSSVAGELRYQVEGANVRIQTDLDGNGAADMEIIVTGTTTLTGADFVF